jgi:hypothetical protein
MQTKSYSSEVLIVRNSMIKTQYDVLLVNYFKEQVETIETNLSFSAAVKVKAMFEDTQETINEIINDKELPEII